MNVRLPPITSNQIATAVAVVSAGVAVWQTIEAKRAAGDSLRAALASERLKSCIQMNRDIEHIVDAASWHDSFKPPYNENKKFLEVMAGVHFLGNEIKEFEIMAPGERTSDLFKSVWSARIALKDMVADGGDVIKQDEFRGWLTEVGQELDVLCDDLVAPSGGF